MVVEGRGQKGKEEERFAQGHKGSYRAQLWLPGYASPAGIKATILKIFTWRRISLKQSGLASE